MLAIIYILEKQRYFLEEATNPVEIQTDYKNLKYFITMRKLNHRQAWQFLYLVLFDFILCYYSEQSMGKPNTLFKRPNYSNRSLDNENIILLYPELLAIQALKGVQLVRAELSILAKVWKGNHFRDLKEPVVKAALKLQQSTNRMVHFLKWLNIDGLLYFREKIYILQTLDLCRKIIALCHDTKIARYLG